MVMSGLIMTRRNLWIFQDDMRTVVKMRHLLQDMHTYMPIHCENFWLFNSLWPNEAIWRHRSGSTLAQVMACCLTAPSRYLNQCWLIISEVLRHSPEGNNTGNAQDIYPWYEFENYELIITAASPRGQWVDGMGGRCILARFWWC